MHMYGIIQAREKRNLVNLVEIELFTTVVVERA